MSGPVQPNLWVWDCPVWDLLCRHPSQHPAMIQQVWSTKTMSGLKCRRRVCKSDLVKLSATISSVGVHIREIWPPSMYLWMTWCLMSMCLDQQLVTGFSARSTAPLFAEGLHRQWCTQVPLRNLSTRQLGWLHWPRPCTLPQMCFGWWSFVYRMTRKLCH